jgi:hypothetical protein
MSNNDYPEKIRTYAKNPQRYICGMSLKANIKQEYSEKIEYLRGLNNAMEHGHYEMVGNKITFYTPLIDFGICKGCLHLERDYSCDINGLLDDSCIRCSSADKCPDSDGLPMCLCEGMYTRFDAKFRKEINKNVN